jgi:hypothetical protein
VSKARHALTKMLVDASAIVIVYVVACAAVFIYFWYTGLFRYVSVDGNALGEGLRFLLGALAIYALLQGATASLGRQAGIVLGFTWTALLALPILSSSSLPQPYHAIVDLLDYANPVVYVAVNVGDNGTVLSYGLAGGALGLACITMLGAAAAIYQWQRVEA